MTQSQPRSNDKVVLGHRLDSMTSEVFLGLIDSVIPKQCIQ